MLELLRQLFHLIYQYTHRKNHAVIWGWPDYEDSVLSLEHELQASDLDHVVVLMTDPNAKAPREFGTKTLRVKKKSISGLLWFLRAKYVFFTHPCFARIFPSDVISVNVWHGMPIKKIGLMLPGKTGIQTSHCLATSPFWSEIMQQAMNPHGLVIDTGLPRNDRLFIDSTDTLKLLEIPADHKLLTWLPTYRQSVRGEPRCDGKEYGNVFQMPDIDPSALNDYLRANHMILIVKPHPMAVTPSMNSFSNLWMICDSWLHAKSVSLYQMLGATDLLISDISSAVIDYLLLDRPIIHAFSDRDAYQNNRGFSMDRIEDWFAGSVVTSMNELIEAIDTELQGKDPHASARARIRSLSHSHLDNNATKRLLEQTVFRS